MALDTVTMAESQRDDARLDWPVPGAILIFSVDRPLFEVLTASDELVVGRGTAGIDDSHVSRAHARVSVADGALFVEDLGSRNGTYFNGERLVRRTRVERSGVLRVGQTLLLIETDLRWALGDRVVNADGFVVGPKVRAVLTEVERAASASNRLLITGETGAGKEAIARAYHRTVAA